MTLQKIHYTAEIQKRRNATRRYNKNCILTTKKLYLLECTALYCFDISVL